jgi:hypothetical protein
MSFYFGPEIKGFTLRKNFGFSFLIAVIAGAAILQLIFLIAELNPDILKTYSTGIGYLSYGYTIIMYFTVATLILIEINHLEEFHIDKFTLLSFVVFAFIRGRTGIAGEGFFLVLICLTGIATTIAWLIKKPEIPRTNLRWAVTGAVIGGISLILIIIIELLLRHNWFIPSFYENNVFRTAIRQIIIEFSSATIVEELLFRGFLWGYMSRKGWGENKILWTQGVMFCFLHFSRVITVHSLKILRNREFFGKLNG